MTNRLELQSHDINLYYEGCFVKHKGKAVWVQHGTDDNSMVVRDSNDEVSIVELNDPELSLDYPTLGMINCPSQKVAVFTTRRSAKQYRRGLNTNNSTLYRLSALDHIDKGVAVRAAITNKFFPLQDALAMVTAKERRDKWNSVALTPKIAIGCEPFLSEPALYYTQFLVGLVRVVDGERHAIISSQCNYLAEELLSVFDHVSYLEV